MSRIERPNLEELLKVWKHMCNRINPLLFKSLEITELEVEKPGWDWYENEYIDWWSNEELISKKKIIEEQSIQGYYKLNKTKVGTRTTAELLWELRNDPEGMALVWIGASMWDKLNSLPRHWRGEIFGRVNTLYTEVTSQLEDKNLYTWHHSSKDALPITLHDNVYTYEALTPSSYEHLVGISAIESMLTYSNWNIVRLISKK